MKRIVTGLVLALTVAFGIGMVGTASAAGGGKAVKKGAKVFKATCFKECHTGTEDSFGPIIKGKGKTLEEIKNQVRNGGDFMPKLGEDKVSDKELEYVKAYLDSFK